MAGFIGRGLPGHVHKGEHFAYNFERAREMDKFLGPDNILWFWDDEADQWELFPRG